MLVPCFILVSRSLFSSSFIYYLSVDPFISWSIHQIQLTSPTSVGRAVWLTSEMCIKWMHRFFDYYIIWIEPFHDSALDRLVFAAKLFCCNGKKKDKLNKWRFSFLILDHWGKKGWLVVLTHFHSLIIPLHSILDSIHSFISNLNIQQFQQPDSLLHEQHLL